MANRYWVTGGTGNWNSTTNWSTASGGASGASVPGSSDAALLDASSGAGTVTLDISPTIQTLTCTGFTGTLAFGTNTISLNSTGTIFTGATTMTVTGTPQIICTNTSATARTISPTAVTESNTISFRITAGTGTFTITTSQGVRDLDFTDGVNPTGYAGALQGGNVNIYGNLKVSTGMTVVAGTGIFNFNATSGTKTINTAGVTFDRPFTFNGVGGTFQLTSALTSGSTRACTLTNGTLDLNGYTLTAGLFSSNNTGVRSIGFGSTGKIVLTSTTGTVLAMSTATNFTYTGTSRIEVTASGAGRTITPVATGAVESNAMSIYVTTGSDTITVSGSARFLNFDLTGFTGTLTYASSSRYFGNLIFSSGMTLGAIGGSFTFAKTSGTQTITSAGKTIDTSLTIDGVGGTVSLQDALSLTGTLTLTNGTLKLAAGTTSTVGMFATSGTNPKFLLSSTPGTQATISDASGTITVTYLTIQDSNATGGAAWDATASTNVNAGNNTGWLLPFNKGVYTSGFPYFVNKYGVTVTTYGVTATP